MHKSRVKKRLPETYRLYEKFLSHIDVGEFRTIVDDIYRSGRNEIGTKDLVKFGRRIIPHTVLRPEDIDGFSA